MSRVRSVNVAVPVEAAWSVTGRTAIDERPVTVATLFSAISTEPDLLPGLLVVEDLVPQARRRAEAYAADR